jgi:hypothetical protein
MLALESNSLLIDGEGFAKSSSRHCHSPYPRKKSINLEVWIGLATWRWDHRIMDREESLEMFQSAHSIRSKHAGNKIVTLQRVLFL